MITTYQPSASSLIVQGLIVPSSGSRSLIVCGTPVIELSKLVNNLKTVYSRLIRRDFSVEIRKTYWKPVFWHRSYCVLTCGGAPLEIIKRYIEN